MFNKKSFEKRKGKNLFSTARNTKESSKAYLIVQKENEKLFNNYFMVTVFLTRLSRSCGNKTN